MKLLVLSLVFFWSINGLADTGYVYQGHLNHDQVIDSIKSGPSRLFGNGGGPFIVSLSDGKGGFVRRELALNPGWVALEKTGPDFRLLSYSRVSCCEGIVGVTALNKNFTTEKMTLHFGAELDPSTLGAQIFKAVFESGHAIEFTRVKNYTPPPALKGGWGK